MRASIVLACLALLIVSASADRDLHAKRNLYVAEDSNARGPRVYDDPFMEDATVRRRRDVSSTPTPPRVSNISTWVNHLNDSHQQLMVHWVGEGSRVIICLARDPAPRKQLPPATSALYISYDYGATFVNKTDSFSLGENSSAHAQLDKFHNHPKYPNYCIFTDSTNKMLFYTSDSGVNIGRTSLDFTPSDLSFHQSFPEMFVVHDKVDPVKKLYLTLDGGRTFTMVQQFVKTYNWIWGEKNKDGVFYHERMEPSGTSQLLVSPSPSPDAKRTSLLKDMQDFQIKGDFMFATKSLKEGPSQLLISHNRGKFYPAEFETELPLIKFQVADVTESRIMVTVMHSENLTCLYVSRISSNFTSYKFALSLHNVMGYFPFATWKDSWLEDMAEEAFTDLYKVEGVRGVYIASKIAVTPTQGSIGTEHLVSVITFDHGVNWGPIEPSTQDETGNPITCRLENSCSLHLSQKFSQLYPVTRSASIISSKSAPGIIMATGVLGKSMKGIPGVFVSRDAGVTWKRILKDYYFFNSGDHGGILVAVKYYKSRGETRRILYSTDEGRTWSSHQFHADDLRVYGLMTEPGENTTTFTMFGSASDHHQWIIITVDLFKAFARNCTASDYKLWSPAAPNSTMSCVLGSRDTYQRRLAHTNCYNGIDYDRPVKKQLCECSRHDYECDSGFIISGNECVRNKSVKTDPYAVPSDCRPGQFYKRTKGYRLIDGDVCISSDYILYEPDLIPCPMNETSEFLVLAMRDKIARIDLETNKTTFFPIEDLKNIVAIEFDLKNNCIYFADIEKDKIGRQCLSNGKYAQEIIVETDLASIEGMAFDWVSNVLFFVDGMRNKIEAVRTDISSSGRMRRTILGPTILNKPRGIAVHPKAGYLFWTDWNSENPAIARSNLDGTNIKKLFGKPIVEWPNGITIDQIAERIYWVDANADYIASADLDGQYFKKVIISDPRVSHPFAVAVLKDRMYWDDWKAGAVFSADKDNGSNIITLPVSVNTLSGFMDLKVFAHFTQHGSNACSLDNTTCNALCLGGPRNTFSCLCPDGLSGRDGHCKCPNGGEPYPNMTCPMTGNTCGPKEWRCTNGLCISETWRCDSDNDCGDGSDERQCPGQCRPPRISCDNGQHCIPPHWGCDNELDCLDRTDEMNCHKHNCTALEFACRNGQCIDAKWHCDGDADCHDGTDEHECPAVKPSNGECLDDDFRCPNSSRCIPRSWRCDGEADCLGGADESKQLCANSTCSDTMFRCSGNGKCIFRAWVCDGEDDCTDGLESDETSCPLSTPRPAHQPPPHETPTNTCLDWMFMCRNGNCVPAWWRCDSINDCGDGTDEIGCNFDSEPDVSVETPVPHNSKGTCDAHHFTCAPGICITLDWVCDSTEDCPGGEDELNCGHVTHAPPYVVVPRCGPTEYLCADASGCIKSSQLCDGVPQCSDKSDEANCRGSEVPVLKCRADKFSCDKGIRCLPRTSVCDSQQDCYDGTDEMNCTTPSILKNFGVGVDRASITSSSFLMTCWATQQLDYSLLPSISKLGSNVWTNASFISQHSYRFIGLEPYTSYNVTFYVRDNKTNKTFASGMYANVTTAEGVPSPPKSVSVTQLSGRRVSVRWDPPEKVQGRLVRYTVYYSPPFPSIEVFSRTSSVEINGNFQPFTNYTFWVTAHNSVTESSRSAPATLEFDRLGDIDALANVSVSRTDDTGFKVTWDRVRGADGYEVSALMPSTFPAWPAARTDKTTYTVSGLPPGITFHLSVSAYKGSAIGRPITIALKTGGQREEMLQMHGALLATDATGAELHWRRPISARYANTTPLFHVFYTSGLPKFSEPKMITTNTSVVIKGLLPCESYFFTVGLKGGPLTPPIQLHTGYNMSSMAVRSLRAVITSPQQNGRRNLDISWVSGCALKQEPTDYILEVEEMNRRSGLPSRSAYKLQTTDNSTLRHVIKDVSNFARFNICVSVQGAEITRCTTAELSVPAPPRNVVAFLAPDGQLVVNFNEPANIDTGINSYEVLVSESELPRSGSPAASAQVFRASVSPFTTSLASLPQGDTLYVAVRRVNAEGYTSELVQVHVRHSQGPLVEASSTVWSAGWYWTIGLGAVAMALMAVLIQVAMKHRRLAGTGRPVSRYNSRRERAVIHERDDDDTPQIHGFSDDEPLVIA